MAGLERCFYAIFQARLSAETRISHRPMGAIILPLTDDIAADPRMAIDLFDASTSRVIGLSEPKVKISNDDRIVVSHVTSDSRRTRCASLQRSGTEPPAMCRADWVLGIDNEPTEAQLPFRSDALLRCKSPWIQPDPGLEGGGLL